jgi:hypothetical protein
MEFYMNLEDLRTLSEKTREDGKRLFGVCEFIYKTAMMVVWAVGGLGLIGGLMAMSSSFWAGIGVLVLTFAFCFFNYVIAVLTTHVAKVMVHTSFANLGILEHLKNSNQEIK